MKEVPLDQIPAGALLGRDIQDASGRVLIGKGTLLTPQQKVLLTKRGIASAWIAEPGDSAPAASGEDDSAAVAEIDHMFAPHEGDPLMAELKTIALACARRA